MTLMSRGTGATEEKDTKATPGAPLVGVDISARQVDAQNHAEGCGLPGPVSPQQADNFMLREDETYLIDDRSAAVSLDQFCGFQKVHAALTRKAAVVSSRGDGNQGR
jgi:hypothetical protein